MYQTPDRCASFFGGNLDYHPWNGSYNPRWIWSIQNLEKKPICSEDFILFVFLCVVSSVLVIVDSLHGLRNHLPEKLKPILENVIESKSEESIIRNLETLNREPNIFNAMLEKREEDNWFIRFLAWPVERPWSHVFGSYNVEKYKAQ